MPITRTAIVDDDGSGTTGTVIDNAWKQQLYDQIDALSAGTAPAAPLVTLIGHGNGTDTNPAAGTSFSGYVGLGAGSLGVFDTIELEIELVFTIGMTPINLVWIQTGAATLANLGSFGNPSTGATIVKVSLRRHPTIDTLMQVLVMGGGTTPAVSTLMPTIDGWALAWALVMQHNGVPASGFMRWKWSITKHAG